MSYAKIIVFNKTLKESLEWMHNRFPKDHKMAAAKSKIVMAIEMTPRLTVLEFMNAIEEYIPQIQRRDETFFLDLATTTDQIQAFRLGDKWSDLQEHEKQHLWSSVDKLVSLAQAIVT